MFAIRLILAVTAILVMTVSFQFLTAVKSTGRVRGEAIRAWAGESEERQAYGRTVLEDCGSGVALFVERRSKASDPTQKTCSALLSGAAAALQTGLTPEDLAPMEIGIDAAYAKNPLPAPLRWL